MNLRELVRSCLEIPSEARFIDAIDGYYMNSLIFLNDSKIYDPPIAINSEADAIIFESNFAKLITESDQYFLIYRCRSNTENRFIGQIVKLPKNSQIQFERMDRAYLRMDSLDGSELVVRLGPTWTNDSREISINDMYWIRDYQGGCKNIDFGKYISIVDKFGEQVVDNDVLLNNRLKPVLFVRINVLNVIIDDSIGCDDYIYQYSSHEMTMDADDELEFDDSTGKYQYRLDNFVKAPKHVYTWTLINKLSS